MAPVFTHYSKTEAWWGVLPFHTKTWVLAYCQTVTFDRYIFFINSLLRKVPHRNTVRRTEPLLSGDHCELCDEFGLGTQQARRYRPHPWQHGYRLGPTHHRHLGVGTALPWASLVPCYCLLWTHEHRRHLLGSNKIINSQKFSDRWLWRGLRAPSSNHSPGTIWTGVAWVTHVAYLKV